MQEMFSNIQVDSIQVVFQIYRQWHALTALDVGVAVPWFVVGSNTGLYRVLGRVLLDHL